VTRRGLDRIASYADGVGLCKDVMIPRDAAGNLTAPTDVIRNAKPRGTRRAWLDVPAGEPVLPASVRSSTNPNAAGDLAGEIRVFLAAGMDGFFTDNPDLGVAAAG